MGFTKIAIARPVFMLMLMVAAILLGTISYRGMRLELNPEVSFPVVTVNTIYPGAGPEEVNTLVSQPLEDAISGVPQLRELSSISQEGFSVVVASFELGTDINAALSDVRTRVDASVNLLPDDSERPTVVKFDTSSQPVLYLAFSSDQRNSQELRDLLDDRLQDRFSQIEGVANASVQGGDVREIQIQLDKDKLLSYGLGIVDVSRQIQAANLNVPGGRILDQDREFQVRVLAEWKSVDQIRNSVLTVQDPRNPQSKAKTVRLGDIATVSDNVVQRTSYSRLDGKDTVILAIQKSREGNAVQITKQAEKLIEDVKKEYPDLTIVKTLEQAKIIENSLEDLNFTLFFAIVLVCSTVFIFLHNLRGTIIVGIAIPVCVFVTFIAMNLAGFTINNLTMLALILAIGVLVDDAIVVLENIYRHLRMGEDPREAALNGRGEIGLAAIAITLADVVVFLPIAFAGGITGQFFKPLALSYVFAVMTSLFVSFTITPMLAARWYRKGEDMEKPKGRFAVAFENGFTKLERGYKRSLEWALNHRWFVFITGNLALVAVFLFIGGSFAGAGLSDPMGTNPNALKGSALYTAAFRAGFSTGLPLVRMAFFIGIVLFIVNSIRNRKFMPKYIAYGALFGMLFPISSGLGGAFGAYKEGGAFKFEFIPSSDNAQVTVNIQLESGSSLEATQKVVERVEKIVAANPRVKYVVSNIGNQGVGGFSGPGSQGSNYAQVLASLYDKGAFLDKVKGSKETLRWTSDTSVSAEILQAVGRIPGAEIKVSTVNAQGFGSPIQISLGSEDPELLASTAEKIRNRLQDGVVPGVINVDTSSTPGKPELQAIPNRERLADTNLTVADVGTALRTLYEGNNQAKLRVGGREFDIRTQLSPEDRNNPRALDEVPIAFREGRPIFLSQVADVRTESSVDRIQRRDREREIQVTADLLPGFAAGSVQSQIDAVIAKEKLVPEGVRVRPLGQAEAQQRESGFLIGAFFLGLVLVYMLLASLYDNLLYPFIIQLAQPQAITGAMLGLVITDKAFSLIGFIGLVTLIGLVGKNAILLVDYTNTLRARGRNRHDAIVEAGPVRLRPIAMTTLALILGTLPIALAIGRGSEFRETIGIVIIGGITLSTLLTLLVIPCSYTIFDDMSIGLGKLLYGRRKSRSGEDDHDSDGILGDSVAQDEDNSPSRVGVD